MIDISFQLRILLVHVFKLPGLLDSIFLPLFDGLLVHGLRDRSAWILALLELQFRFEVGSQI